MKALDNLIAPAQQKFDSLEKREQNILIAGSITLAIILFYLLIWDPIMAKHEQQKRQLESQKQLYSWMKGAAHEINTLKSTGGGIISRTRNQSISSLTDRSALTTGIKPFISKIDQSKTGVKVVLKSADFDRIITWLSDLETKYGIKATKVKIETAKKQGSVDAQVTLERNE